MYRALPLLLILSSPAYSEAPLNWTTLEVSAVEEEQPATTEKIQIPTDDRFASTLDRMRNSVRVDSFSSKRKVEAVNKETVYSAIQDLIENSYPGGVDALVESHAQMEQEIYRLLKMLPPYAYQYVGPFLHDLPYMSDRILNMPGIKETKGKFPTRIAPQMQEYAKKYGKHMSKHLYLYLMPEAWATTQREPKTFRGYTKQIQLNDKTKIDDLFILNQTLLSDKYGMLSADDYRTGKALQKQNRPQTPVDEVTQTSALTEGDIESSLASFEAITQAFGNNRFDDFHTAIRDMSLTDNNLMEELRNPMQTLADKIKRLPQSAEFSRVVAKHGFTIDTWAITADKIIKARRVATMSPAIASTVGTWRKFKAPPKSFDALSPRDKQVSWDSIRLFVDLYTTTDENLLAVKNYGDNIRHTFATRDMMVLESPVYGIY